MYPKSHGFQRARPMRVRGLLLLLVACACGCEHREPVLVLRQAALTGDRLRLVVDSYVAVTGLPDAPSYEIGHRYYVVSMLLGTAAPTRLEVADVNAGYPPQPERLMGSGSGSRATFLLGAADDRVVRVALDPEQVDVLAPPPADPATGGLPGPWRVVRSWRPAGLCGHRSDAMATQSGSHVVTRHDPLTVLDVVALREVPLAGLGKAICIGGEANMSGPGGRLTAGLKYAVGRVGEDAGGSGPDDRAAVAIDDQGHVVARFPFVRDRAGVLAVDESEFADGPADVWCLYRRHEDAADAWRYTLVDRALVARREVNVPSTAEPLGGLQEAYWDAKGRRVLFYNGDDRRAGERPVRVRVWSYPGGTLTERRVDVAGVFRVSGGRYVPKG